MQIIEALQRVIHNVSCAYTTARYDFVYKQFLQQAQVSRLQTHSHENNSYGKMLLHAKSQVLEEEIKIVFKQIYIEHVHAIFSEMAWFG